MRPVGAEMFHKDRKTDTMKTTCSIIENTRVGTLIVATIYLQLIQN